jgi:hypothetical protein
MRRAAREVRRLRRALRGALSQRDVELRVQHFEARDQWPPEVLDRLRLGLPGYIARKPLPWPLRMALFLRYTYNWRGYREAVASVEAGRAADIRARALYAIAQRTEAELAGVVASLDDLALGPVGGLRFRLDSSTRYALELEALMKSLRISTIPTWVSYDVFVERGVAPAFDHMQRVAARLRAAEAKVRAVAESVEASVERGHPAVVRHAAAAVWRSAAYATVLAVLLVLALRSAAGAAFIDRAGDIVRRLLALAQAHLPPRLAGLIEQAFGWLQSFLP